MKKNNYFNIVKVTIGLLSVVLDLDTINAAHYDGAAHVEGDNYGGIHVYAPVKAVQPFVLSDEELHQSREVKDLFRQALMDYSIFSQLEELSLKGNRFAQVCWGDGVLKGKVKEKSNETAQRFIGRNSDFFSKEIQGEVPFVIFLRGIIFEHSSQRDKAKECYFESATLGYFEVARYYHGHLLYKEKEDLNSVVVFFEDAMSRNLFCAHNALAFIYDEGKLVIPNKIRAIELYRIAAANGYAPALYNLGQIYEKGEGVGVDIPQALLCYEEGCQKHDAHSQIRMGMIYEDGLYGRETNKQLAFSFYELAARQGLGSAQYRVAEMYYAGEGVLEDKRVAFAWYQRAANQGLPNAQYEVGKMYHNGDGIDKNLNKALEFYTLAANARCDRAQVALGRMYEKGEGVLLDYEKAVSFYQLAANQNNHNAQLFLALFYYKRGGMENIRRALEYCRLSAEQGNAAAIETQEKIKKKLEKMKTDK